MRAVERSLLWALIVGLGVAVYGFARQVRRVEVMQARQFTAMRDAMLVSDEAIRRQILAEGMLNWERDQACVR